jgi:hypothetical protein
VVNRLGVDAPIEGILGSDTAIGGLVALSRCILALSSGIGLFRGGRLMRAPYVVPGQTSEGDDSRRTASYVEASTSWRRNLLLATPIAQAILASPISAVGRCLTRDSQLTRGDITIDPVES